VNDHPPIENRSLGQPRSELLMVFDLPNDRIAPKAALGRLEIQLPLYPRKQTQLGNRGTSEKCR